MIAEARRAVADALKPLGIPAHAYPPGTLSPPSAVVIAGTPYVDGYTLNGAYLVGLEVQLVTGVGAHERLDDLILAAYRLLAAAKCRPGTAEPPRPDRDTGLLTARIPVTVTWKD